MRHPADEEMDAESEVRLTEIREHKQTLSSFSTVVIALCSVEGLGGSNCDVNAHLHSSQSFRVR